MTRLRQIEAATVAFGVLGLHALRSIEAARPAIPWITAVVLGVFGVVLAIDVRRIVRRFREERASYAKRDALNKAYASAFERGDHEEVSRLRRELDALQPAPATRSAKAQRAVGEAEALLVAERWAEARDVLATIDRDRLAKASRPGVLNNLAYATALAGDPVKGGALAEQALAEADLDPTYPSTKRDHLRGTRGVALHLSGAHEAAVRLLDPLARSATATPRAIATRAFYLGLALEALGRHDEALGAWELGAGGEGPFAERSRKKVRGGGAG